MSRRVTLTDRIRAAQEQMNGTKLGEQMSLRFIEEHTGLTSIEALEAAMASFESPDAFVRSRTSFASWFEFENAAWMEWAKEALSRRMG